jgi:uncharacterized membrane protein/dienelactone hydrolase
MIAIRLILLIPVILALALLHALPMLPGRARLFGVEVPREVRYGSHGRRLLRRYQMRLLPVGMAALLAAAWMPVTWLWLAIATPAIAALWLHYRGHADAVGFALPAPSRREASLLDDAGGLARRLLWFAPPLAVLMATAFYLAANWSRFPARYASHFDLHGVPNGWAVKSLRGCFGSLALGAAIVLCLLALYAMIELGSRRGTQRPAMLASLAGSAFAIGPAFALLGQVHAFVPPLWIVIAFLGLIGACILGLAVLLFRMVSKPAEGPPEVTPDRCWHGSFYFNPQDAALFVDGRTGFGLTANFARRAVWLLLGAIAVVTAGLLLLAPTLLAQTAPAPEEIAQKTIVRMVDGKYDELFQSFSPEMRTGLPVEVLRSRVGPQVNALGKLLETRPPAVQQVGGNTVLIVPARFQTLWIDFTITVNSAGQVSGLYMKPGQGPASDWKPPAYSKPDSFTERAFTVGVGEWKLPGTLSVPRSPSPSPAMVLVHGSGPEDRDETLLGNKPFRDIAEGLASQGIAVLRYEKRNREYGAKMAAMPNLTVEEETVADAVAAAGQLRAEPGIDPKRVFLLGHSLGGYLIPMMLAQAPEAAGGIILAGEARPLEDLVLDQSEYVASLPGGDTPEARKQLEETRQVVASIKALQPGHEDGPPIFGAWPHYWIDLRAYDPIAAARKIVGPLLILQGERDYQVTMKDFRIWQAALGGRSNVTMKSYPALNHLFMAGQGKSTPAEYAVPGHVSAEAIGDIARWILAH